MSAREGRGWLGVALVVGLIAAIATLPGCTSHRAKARVIPPREALTLFAAPGEHTFAMLGQARLALEASWDDTPEAKEKGFCVTRWSRVQLDSSSILLVHGIERAANERNATSGSVFFSCAGRPTAHSHPLYWCGQHGQDSLCVRPPDGTFCRPSNNDYLHLLATAAPFGLIQCDRSRFVVYLPPGRAP